MERWRSFFGSCGEDLWTVIDRAIIIAAIDYPQELRVRRDSFAEKLFTPASYFTTCNAAEKLRLEERIENMFDPNLCPLTSSIGDRPALTRSDGGTGASIESETAGVLEGQCKNHQITIPNDSTLETVKPLTEDTILEESEESRQIREIRGIKEQIINFDQGEEACFLQLCKLEKMNICVPALKGTGIGKPVNGLRKHSSKRVRTVAKRLVSSWKDVVDEWVRKKGDDFAVAFIDSSSHGINGSKIEALSQCHNDMEVVSNTARSTKISDIRDDKFSTEAGEMDTSEHRCIAAKHNDASLLDPQSSFQTHKPHKSSYTSDAKAQRDKLDHAHDLSNKEPNSRHRYSISVKEKFECVIEDSKSVVDGLRNNLDVAHQGQTAHYSPHANEAPPEQKVSSYKIVSDMKSKCKETVNELNHLESAKQRLQNNYQQADKAKKQRTLQLVDMDTMPKGTAIDSLQLKCNWTGVHAKRACPTSIR